MGRADLAAAAAAPAAAPHKASHAAPLAAGLVEGFAASHGTPPGVQAARARKRRHGRPPRRGAAADAAVAAAAPHGKVCELPYQQRLPEPSARFRARLLASLLARAAVHSIVTANAPPLVVAPLQPRGSKLVLLRFRTHLMPCAVTLPSTSRSRAGGRRSAASRLAPPARQRRSRRGGAPLHTRPAAVGGAGTATCTSRVTPDMLCVPG